MQLGNHWKGNFATVASITEFKGHTLYQTNDGKIYLTNRTGTAYVTITEDFSETDLLNIVNANNISVIDISATSAEIEEMITNSGLQKIVLGSYTNADLVDLLSKDHLQNSDTGTNSSSFDIDDVTLTTSTVTGNISVDLKALDDKTKTLILASASLAGIINKTDYVANAGLDIAYGDGVYVIAGTNAVYTSTDLTSWDTYTTGHISQCTWASIIYGGGKFVAVAISGGSISNRVAVSSDGETWLDYNVGNISYRDICYANNLYVIVGASICKTSTNATSWTTRSIAGDDDTWLGICHGNGLFVAVGSGTDYCATSPDGITWTARTLDAGTWESVAYANGLYVAVSSTGTKRIATSPDGITWLTSDIGDNDIAWKRIIYNTSVQTFVAVGDDGESIGISGDGKIWGVHAFGASDQTFGGLASNGSDLVAVSGSGTNNVLSFNINNSMYLYKNSNEYFFVDDDLNSYNLLDGSLV